MTFAPPKLKELAAYWVAQGGVNLGIVGDIAHQAKGVSYHLGKDQLMPGAYSIQTARDKAGLSLAASAIDLGRLDGSLTDMYAFMSWFAHKCQDNYKVAPWRDVREVIYWSTVRNRVIGWSALDPGTFINDYGDLSHKTHGHISFYRDSEFRDKLAMFQPYFDKASTGGNEVGYPVPKVPSIGDVTKDAELYTTNPFNLADPLRKIVNTPPLPRVMPWHGTPSSGVEAVEYVNDQGVHSGMIYFMKSALLTNRRPLPSTAPPPVDAVACKPFTYPLNTRIDELEEEVTTAKLAGAQEEYDQIEAAATVAVKLPPRP